MYEKYPNIGWLEMVLSIEKNVKTCGEYKILWQEIDEYST
jgi:hypothetical protein